MFKWINKLIQKYRIYKFNKLLEKQKSEMLDRAYDEAMEYIKKVALFGFDKDNDETIN